MIWLYILIREKILQKLHQLHISRMYVLNLGLARIVYAISRGSSTESIVYGPRRSLSTHAFKHSHYLTGSKYLNFGHSYFPWMSHERFKRCYTEFCVAENFNFHPLCSRLWHICLYHINYHKLLIQSERSRSHCCSWD